MKTVLIADDALFMRTALKNLLIRNGYEVVGEAENGKIALEMYKTLKPDIVTMDITMPVMSGIEALESIIQYDSKANVVMISAMGQEHMVRQAIILGAKTFIVKPYKEEHVIKVLEKLINE